MNILYIAATIIVIIGLKFLSPFLVYLILSLFLTVLVYPFINFLEKRGVPLVVGYIFVSFLVVGIFGIIFMIINSSLKEFLQNAPLYEDRFSKALIEVNGYLSSFGIRVDNLSFDFIPLIKMVLAKAGNLLSGFLIVFIGVSFLIFESKSFGNKLSLISTNKTTLEIFFRNIQKYFVIKTFTSALTGISVALMLLYFGVPYAYLFGILAFIFNFIPVIGSIVAAIPGVFITFITYDLEVFVYVSIGYLIINNLISNVIEPKLMGDGLDLSPAVVFFSLLVWGWVFGIVGMFLAAPLTMSLKLALLSNKKSEWLGRLLSK